MFNKRTPNNISYNNLNYNIQKKLKRAKKNNKTQSITKTNSRLNNN